MLKKEGKITDYVIESLMKWRHTSGFNVYCGCSISPSDKTALENLARYIVRAPFSRRTNDISPEI
jgi:hypothetical protein